MPSQATVENLQAAGGRLLREVPRWGDAVYPWDEVDASGSPGRGVDWRGVLVVTGLSAAAIGAVWVLGVVVIALVSWLYHHIVGWAGAVRHWSVTRIVLNPVHRYLTTHAAGLPASGHHLYIVWVWLVVGALVLAMLGSRAARIGWIALGLMSAAMAWAATASPGQWIAAGVTVLWWAFLSMFALLPADELLMALDDVVGEERERRRARREAVAAARSAATPSESSDDPPPDTV